MDEKSIEESIKELYVNEGLSVGFISQRLKIDKSVIRRIITRYHLKHTTIRKQNAPSNFLELQSKLDDIYKAMAKWPYDELEYVAEKFHLSKEEVEYVIETFKRDGRWDKIEENVKAFMDYYPGGI